MSALSDVDRFIDYAAEFKPGFRHSIRGATEQEIQELVRLVGAPLPDDVYEAFLMRMGHDDGGLVLAMEGTTDISRVMDYYRDCLKDEPEPFPAGCVVIGAWRISGDVCLERVDGKRPRVVFTEGDEVLGLYAESFIGLLYRSAFEVFRLAGMASWAFYGASYFELGRSAVLEAARQIAIDIGFREHWFSDGIVFCGEMPGVAIAITQYKGEGMGVSLGAEKKSKLEEVAGVFVERFGLRMLR